MTAHRETTCIYMELRNLLQIMDPHPILGYSPISLFWAALEV